MTQVRAARITRTGGPDVIEFVDLDLPAPGPGEVRFRSTAIGLNFIDTYHRSGLYPLTMPSGLGVEAAGVVDAVGEGVAFKVGDRVATFGPGLGAYSTARNVAAGALFAIPDDVTDEIAAAALLKACTTEFLVERCARVEPGSWCLVHAAAGGVGLMLVQWLKHVGAQVIGTVSTDEKARAAADAGADVIINYTRESIVERVRASTEGAGARATFDGVGKATWAESLEATGKRGLIVSYGNASGPVAGINLGVLASKGSLFVTRPTLFDYYATPDDRTRGIARVWDMLGSGKLRITIGQTYPLEQAADAHRDLEAKKTTGSTILTV